MTNFTFSFDSRETYIAYRTEWRATYQELSQEIRALKNIVKDEQRSGKGTQQHILQRKRNKAAEMMAELDAAKLFKNEQLNAAIEA
jgi:hypothetical protein